MREYVAVIDEHFQIGEVAESVGLSLRTIRYYEEIGLVSPSGRSEGGFRLYTESDIERLRLVKALKPIGMSLETMGELLEAANQAGNGRSSSSAKRLEEVLEVARHRCDELEDRLHQARDALEGLSSKKTGRRV
ncbi:MAG TPA: MerR family transcriptional regulator [Acidimicrobiia bacterium]|nr:MerR family transcriptional regulator [Acidimicrobiia bacterium]